MTGADAPDAATWDAYADDLELYLGSLRWAGWSDPVDDLSIDGCSDSGPTLCMSLRRTCMALNVELRPVVRELRLQPAGADDCRVFSMLDAEIVLELPRDRDDQQRCVADLAGELGFTDRTCPD